MKNLYTPIHLCMIWMLAIPVVLGSYYTSSGISFAEEGELYVTGHRLLIHADLAMDPYVDNMDRILERVNASKYKLMRMLPVEPKIENKTTWLRERTVLLGLLDGIYTAAVGHFKDFTEYLRTVELSRNKRGLIDIGGTLFKTLFGLATEHDVQEVHRILEYVATSQNDTIKQLNLHTIVLNHTIDDLVNITAHINNIYGQMDVLDDSLADSIVIIKEGKLVTLVHIMSSQILNSLQSLELDLLKLRNAIFEAYDGRLDPYLIPPTLALGILKKAAQNPHVRLPFEVSERSLPKYYSIASIIPFRKSAREFAFSIIVPLVSDGNAYTLYSINTLPVPSSDQYSVRIKMEDKFLAVSQNRQMFISIRHVKHCIVTHNTYLCPPNEAIYDFNTGYCSIAAFQDKPHRHLCNTQVFHGDLSYLRRLGNKWLFSFSPARNGTMLCTGRKASHLRLHGFGHLTLPSGCTLTIGKIYVPSLETIHIGNVSLTLKDPLPLSPMFDDDEILLMKSLNNSHSAVRGQSLSGFKKDLHMVKLRRQQVLLHASIGHSTATVALIISLVLLSFFVISCIQERCYARRVDLTPQAIPIMQMSPQAQAQAPNSLNRNPSCHAEPAHVQEPAGTPLLPRSMMQTRFRQ